MFFYQISTLTLGVASNLKAFADFTGALTVAGSDGKDTIKCGSGDDTITGGLGNDVITGGAGKDTFIVGTAATTGSGAGGIDHITDLVGGVDIIKTGNYTTVAVKLTDKGDLTSGNAALADALTTFADAGINATKVHEAYTFTYANHTYLLVDNGDAGYIAGADSVIDITGVTGTLVAGDIFNAA